jgi:hypothetical protein
MAYSCLWDVKNHQLRYAGNKYIRRSNSGTRQSGRCLIDYYRVIFVTSYAIVDTGIGCNIEGIDIA